MCCVVASIRMTMLQVAVLLLVIYDHVASIRMIIASRGHPFRITRHGGVCSGGVDRFGTHSKKRLLHQYNNRQFNSMPTSIPTLYNQA